eukprot:365526-Chlamydomonas_euryale.AAC.12
MGHVNVIEALIDYGADVKLSECNGRTPLHLAARGCHVDAMRALIESLSMREAHTPTLPPCVGRWALLPIRPHVHPGGVNAALRIVHPSTHPMPRRPHIHECYTSLPVD